MTSSNFDTEFLNTLHNAVAPTYWVRASEAVRNWGHAHDLWLDTAGRFLTRTMGVERPYLDPQTALEHMWNNTIAQIPDFKISQTIVECAVNKHNLEVVQYFLQHHDSERVAQIAQLLNPASDTFDAFQQMFLKAVQHNEVDYIQLALPHVSRFDGSGRHFLAPRVVTAATNISPFQTDECFQLLWNACDADEKDRVLEIAQQEYDEAPFSVARTNALNLITSKHQRIKLMQEMDALQTPTPSKRKI